jgi:hypothetical protein
MDRLPTSLSELKSSPPTAWTQDIEQIVMRSMSFSEFEMMSHPLVVLTVVSTADADPLAAMQELASIHHTPQCFTNGQYDPLIQRVYVLLDDAGERTKDAFVVLRSLSTRFPSSNTKLVSINSFTAAAPNLQQPDVWKRFIIPNFFPEHAPSPDANQLPRDPFHHRVVLGNRLSVEDFMKLREFCIWLFNEQIVPAIEKRLTVLSKLVNDSRKGVKNVLKSFWRKPRDETETPKGSIKYRYDKIETQTLLLADTAFMVRDYETAASMYKLVRDDYKADKSILHLAYSLLMIAACQLVAEPHKYRETQSYLEAMSQCLVPSLDLVHGSATLALIGAEMHVASNYARAPLESARLLLQASQNVIKYPLLSGLLIERAGLFMLQASQTRRYVFHSILSGNKLYRCGAKPAKHAMTCFAAAMLLLEKGNWDELKIKLSRALSRDLKAGGQEGKQRSLMLLLKILASNVNAAKAVSDQSSLIEAIGILNEIRNDGGWGNIRINDGWSQCLVRDILLGPLPIGVLDSSSVKSRIEICGLSMPEIDMDSLAILEPVNGFDVDMLRRCTPEILEEVELMKELLSAEREICPSSSVTQQQQATLAQRWAKIHREQQQQGYIKARVQTASNCTYKVQIPLGERMLFRMKICNKLPVDLNLTGFCMGIDRGDHFDIQKECMSLPADQSMEVMLQARPLAVGSYQVVNAQWSLSDNLMIKQQLNTQGPLLQRTLQQRATHERAKDNRLFFDVIPGKPLLRISFEGLSSDALQGQFIRSRLRIVNEGAASAQNIYLKCSHPWFLFFVAEDGSAKKSPLEHFGCSSTVIYLAGQSIASGQSVELDAWLRIHNVSVQNIKMLAVYGQGVSSTRSSFLSVHIECLPCAKLSVQLVPKISSTVRFTLVAEMTNMLQANIASSSGHARASSLAPTDHPDFTAGHVDVDENCVKIVGLRLLGAAQLCASKSKAEASSLDAEFRYLMLPGERVAECFPIKFLSPQKSAGRASWLLAMSALEEGAFGAVTGKGAHLQDLLEGFQCLWYRVDMFMQEVANAMLSLELEEVEADVMGPRSIADVRRERLRKTNDDAVDSADGGMMTEIALDESSKQVSSLDLIRNLQSIADKEVSQNSFSVAVVWVCRWRNKMRWGLHHVPNVGFASALLHSHNLTNCSAVQHSVMIAQKLVGAAPSPSISTATATATALTLAVTGGMGLVGSALQFSISHVHHMQLASRDRISEVQVLLKVRSFVDMDTILQVRVRPEKGGEVPKTFRGLAFVDQISYSNVPLAAHGEAVLTFHAQVSSVGVHDLNRYSWSVYCHVH